MGVPCLLDDTGGTSRRIACVEGGSVGVAIVGVARGIAKGLKVGGADGAVRVIGVEPLDGTANEEGWGMRLLSLLAAAVARAGVVDAEASRFASSRREDGRVAGSRDGGAGDGAGVI